LCSAPRRDATARGAAAGLSVVPIAGAALMSGTDASLDQEEADQ
jgi:hypothetical protein